MDYPIKISVVMPTYNTPVPMLKEAIDSILNQTFTDFEFIIIDDGSTNDSPDYLDNLQDGRIILIRNQNNIGITKSLNIGLSATNGKYIARMDSDDISLPNRFEKQFLFMEKHPEVIACGTNYEYFGLRSGISNNNRIDMERYKIDLLFKNPGPSHPTLFLRHEALQKYNIKYDENLIYAQDYGLYTELSHYGKIEILPDVLLRYRYHVNQVGTEKQTIQRQYAKLIQFKLLSVLLKDISTKEIDMHFNHCPTYNSSATISPEIDAWFTKIIDANDKKRIYNAKKLRYCIYNIERRLIEQTWRKEMSKLDKAKLYFQYLPFFYAVKVTLDTLYVKYFK